MKQREEKIVTKRSPAASMATEGDMSTEINPTTGLRLDLFGPTLEFLTSPQEAGIDFCVLRGVIRRCPALGKRNPPGLSLFAIPSGGYC
jgi:hypothetical protein